jgi:hypothetical protein
MQVTTVGLSGGDNANDPETRRIAALFKLALAQTSPAGPLARGTAAAGLRRLTRLAATGIPMVAWTTRTRG